MNQITLTGNLGRDPEMHYTPSGSAVTEFTLASTHKYKDGAGHAKEETVWFHVSCWGKLAETTNEYLVKGSKALVNGRVSLHEWEHDGRNHARLQVTAATVEFLSTKQAEPVDATPV